MFLLFSFFFFNPGVVTLICVSFFSSLSLFCRLAIAPPQADLVEELQLSVEVSDSLHAELLLVVPGPQHATSAAVQTTMLGIARPKP